MSDLRIVAPWAAATGYGHMARAVLSCALKAGFNVEARESDYRVRFEHYRDGRQVETRIYNRVRKPVPDYQLDEIRAAKRNRVPLSAPTLFVQIPESLEAWQEFSSGPRIGWTMCESDRLNPRWARCLEGVDLLLAPSRYVLETFRRDVKGVRCELVPLPVDDRLWTPTSETTEFNRRNLPSFIFFSVFTTIPRKGWQMMMQAFGEEFAGEDVGLIVRPSCTPPVYQLAQWVNRIEPYHPPGQFFLQVLGKKLTDESLADYYRMADCYVLPSAEGFGLPFVEAALCGTPSIALDKGGSADVVDDATGYPVPSIMAPCYGQLPHVYPSHHEFPTATIEAMKRTFRRAYKHETEVYQKGSYAREKALAQFTPAAIAPKLREMVEASHEEHRRRIRIWSLTTVPQYAIVIGDGYGDAMASYGNARAVTKARLCFLHYGFNKGLCEWLAIQPGIYESRQLVPASPTEFRQIADNAGGYYGRPVSTWLPHILEGTGIDPATVAPTQVHWPWGAWEVHRPAGMVLSDEAEAWASQMRAELGEFILVQPYSTSSVDVSAHWPHWGRFLKWLLERCESSHLLVFAGLNKIHGLERPSVVDLIGKSPSMQHVLALADRAKGVVSTCNALANWTAIRGIKGLIATNGAIPRPDQFWRRFMATPNNTVMPLETSCEQMQAAAEKWLEEIGK